MSPEVRFLSANGHKRTLGSGLVLSVRPEEPVAAVRGTFSTRFQVLGKKHELDDVEQRDWDHS